MFRRILRLLRPQWGMIALAVLLLLMSLPAELFPGLTWLYVTDYLILDRHTRPVEILNHLFSFNDHISGKIQLLISSVSWMFGIYLTGELFGTLSTVLMSIAAQRFTLLVRNDVYHKLQSQSLAYLHRQRIGDLMSRAMGDVDELQSFLVNGIDQILGEGLQWVGTVVLVMCLNWKVATTSLAPLYSKGTARFWMCTSGNSPRLLMPETMSFPSS